MVSRASSSRPSSARLAALSMRSAGPPCHPPGGVVYTSQSPRAVSLTMGLAYRRYDAEASFRQRPTTVTGIIDPDDEYGGRARLFDRLLAT
jgi:hypothetical protein